MKTLSYRHRQNLSARRCWFYQPSMDGNAWGGNGSEMTRPDKMTRFNEHLHKWLQNTDIRPCADKCSVITTDSLHALRPAWGEQIRTEKRTPPLQKVKEQVRTLCLGICALCENNPR